MSWYSRILPGSSDQRRIEELEGRVQELTEQRSIDSLPWNVGADLGPRTPTPTRALRLAPVYGAVSMIARSISTTPIHAYRSTGNGRQRMPALPQLFKSPSIHGDITDWLHRCLTSLLLDGNAFGLITARDGYGYPTMIEWLHPQQVYVVDEGQWGRGSYWSPIYYWRGREVDAEQLVHIPFFSLPFKVRGMSPLSAFAAAIDIGLDGQQFASDWYKAGGSPPGTFKNSAKKLNKPEADEAKNWLVSAIRTHEPIVYGADWDYAPVTVNPKDAIFVETHRMSATDIATVYGIYPPERIGGETKSSNVYSNIEAEQIQWVNTTLAPYVRKLESVFFDLLPEPQDVRFNLDAQIRTDTHTRYLIHQISREIGLKNVDELRDVEDLPHLPNKQGEDYNPLVAVRELIRSAAVSTFNPNMPGFQAGEPGATQGVVGAPTTPTGGGTPPPAGQPGLAAAAAPGKPTAAPAPNGRFTGRPEELVPAGRSQESESDRPPF